MNEIYLLVNWISGQFPIQCFIWVAFSNSADIIKSLQVFSSKLLCVFSFSFLPTTWPQMLCCRKTEIARTWSWMHSNIIYFQSAGPPFRAQGQSHESQQLGFSMLSVEWTARKVRSSKLGLCRLICLCFLHVNGFLVCFLFFYCFISLDNVFLAWICRICALVSCNCSKLSPVCWHFIDSFISISFSFACLSECITLHSLCRILLS